MQRWAQITLYQKHCSTKRNLIFLISEVQRNFLNELFGSVEALRNCGTAFLYQVKAQPYFRN